MLLSNSKTLLIARKLQRDACSEYTRRCKGVEQIEGRFEVVQKSRNLEISRWDFVQILDRCLKAGLKWATKGTKSFVPFVILTLHFAVAALAGSFGLAILFAQHGLARELDLVPLAADALHENLLALFQFVADVFHASIRDLRDVQ